jgi:hypothetical protein
MRTAAAEIRESVRVSVSVAGTGQPQPLLEGEFRKAIESLGLQASDAAVGCRGETVTHTVEIEARAICKKGYVAMSCALEFPVTVQSCGSDDRSNGLVKSDQFKASDNQMRENRATDRAWEKLSSEPLRPGLRELFGSILPID